MEETARDSTTCSSVVAKEFFIARQTSCCANRLVRFSIRCVLGIMRPPRICCVLLHEEMKAQYSGKTEIKDATIRNAYMQKRETFLARAPSLIACHPLSSGSRTGRRP